ncbi:MAG TPA: class I SAM-dependent methyltransferase [Anaerolineaceae bacterium]
MTIKANEFDKAAERGVPSLVWRAGQDRRLEMIAAALDGRRPERVLVDGCGIGAYAERLTLLAGQVLGLDIEVERVIEASANPPLGERRVIYLGGAGEYLPFADDTFALVLSHEVLEHVQDDRAAIREIVRTLCPGGRLVLFCPNRGYPFETHGFYWRGAYHFGNIPLINYLPRRWRDRLAPHVSIYTRGDLERLFAGLPVRFVERRIIFGAYDNVIARRPRLGRLLRSALQWLERPPFQIFGLSHFWVVEKAS